MYLNCTFCVRSLINISENCFATYDFTIRCRLSWSWLVCCQCSQSMTQYGSHIKENMEYTYKWGSTGLVIESANSLPLGTLTTQNNVSVYFLIFKYLSSTSSTVSISYRSIVKRYPILSSLPLFNFLQSFLFFCLFLLVPWQDDFKIM